MPRCYTVAVNGGPTSWIGWWACSLFRLVAPTASQSLTAFVDPGVNLVEIEQDSPARSNNTVDSLLPSHFVDGAFG